ncbi:TIGR01777 family oxidoreductase [Zhouia sp. PK063]|uniref:TIGR01777 family oxidoreductase n=1 Tax=Zhouia sp. PK063 TaxID=3373602 RepID=UPI0037B4853D
MKEKIVIASGTGFLGNILISHFKNTYNIVVLTREKSKQENNITYQHWDAKSVGNWSSVLEDAKVLINLTGKSVNCRYTSKNKKAILQSRTESTFILNQAIILCKNPPKHFINASTATIYVDSRHKKMTEENGVIGNDFSMTVAQQWEETFFNYKTPNTLKTALRIGIVLGKNGGAFIPLKRLTQFGFGGKQGDGHQLMSWIHELDFARAVQFIIDHQLENGINVTSPNTITNKTFMQLLKTETNTIIALPTPTFLLKLGAKIIGTEPELVLKSRNVIPKILEDRGFQFLYPNASEAIQNLLS